MINEDTMGPPLTKTKDGRLSSVVHRNTEKNPNYKQQPKKCVHSLPRTDRLANSISLSLSLSLSVCVLCRYAREMSENNKKSERTRPGVCGGRSGAVQTYDGCGQGGGSFGPQQQRRAKGAGRG